MLPSVRLSRYGKGQRGGAETDRKEREEKSNASIIIKCSSPRPLLSLFFHFPKKKKKKKKIYLVDALAFLFPSGMITLKQSFPFSVSPQFSTRKVKLSSRRISVASFFPKESES